ncbi:hypothetical protein [Micromonospora zhanjiangensis]
MRKGTAKTELAGWIAFAELHPDAPVRTDGWKRQGRMWVPVGRPVRDPYIPMIAHTEEQTEELAYAALLVMCSEGPDQDLFDCTLERITRASGEGKAVALASAPDSRDGARTTFQHADEPHRLKLPRQVQAWQTMLQNIPKRPIADPWSLSTTTAGVPGEGSVAESEREYARRIAEGKARDPQLFYFHREASTGHKLSTDDGLRAAIVEASGPAVAKWSDIDSIMSLYHQADTDKAYFERVWLNRWVASSRQAFDPVRWKELKRDVRIEHGEPIVLGFDGARWRDACGFVATHIETGLQWTLALWEKPPGTVRTPSSGKSPMSRSTGPWLRRWTCIGWCWCTQTHRGSRRTWRSGRGSTASGASPSGTPTGRGRSAWRCAPTRRRRRPARSRTAATGTWRGISATPAAAT